MTCLKSLNKNNQLHLVKYKTKISILNVCIVKQLYNRSDC